MPPKLKKTGNTKSGSLDGGDDLGPAEQLARAEVEIANLLRELNLKNDINAKLRTQLQESKEQIHELEDAVEAKNKDRIELTSDMSRQYKVMQTELTGKVKSLEAKVDDYKTKLEDSQRTLQETRARFEQVIAEKDTAIEEQNAKMTFMSSEFESMLHDMLSKMTKKLEAISEQWEEAGDVHLSDANQRRLADFHLVRLQLTSKDRSLPPT